MLEISNCPDSGLVRKVDHQFFWLKLNRKIMIQCHVSHYKRDPDLFEAYQVALSAYTENPTGTTKPVENYDTKVENLAIKTFIKELVASDTLVNPTNGVILTQEQLDTYYNSVSTYQAYETSYAQFQLQTTAYNNYLTDLATYQSDLDAYYIAYSAWTANTGNTMPVPPIQPIEVIEPVEPIEPPTPGLAPMQEYDFYTYVLGVTPIILPDLIESIITARDLEGKFNT